MPNDKLQIQVKTLSSGDRTKLKRWHEDISSSKDFTPQYKRSTKVETGNDYLSSMAEPAGEESAELQTETKNLKKRIREAMKIQVEKSPEFFGDMHLNLSILRLKTPKQILKMYLESLVNSDNKMVYFYEEVLLPSMSESEDQIKFKHEVQYQKESRLSDELRGQKEKIILMERVAEKLQTFSKHPSWENLQAVYFANRSKPEQELQDFFKDLYDQQIER